MKSYTPRNLKLEKRFAAIFVIAAMLLAMVIPAGAVSDNIVSVSSIDFVDGNGNSVQSLDGLSKVGAGITVKTRSSQKMIFVLALYGENNKLLKIDREEKRATSSGTVFEAAIEYNIPENAEGYKLNAFLLDSVKDMNAIARGSLFPSGNLDISNLYVTIGNNEPVDLMALESPKDGVYKIDVPIDIEFAPAVKVVPVDNGTKAEVTPPSFFPGYSDIKLTATNGATKSYRIEYVAKSTVTSIAGAVGTDFHEPGDNGAEYGSQYWNDRSSPTYTGSELAYYNDIRSISDEWDYLKGSTYYMAGVNTYTNPSYKSDRSTTVRVFGTAAISGEGWTSATNSDGHITVSHTTGAGVEGHKEYQAARKMTVVSSKTFPAGTVTLPAISKEFVVVVEPSHYVPESHRAFLVDSITANGEYIDTSAGPGVYSAPVSSDIIYAPEITEADIAFRENYGDRIVEITNPTSFPGQSVIKITSGEDSVEYIVNYSLGDLVTNASSNMGTNFHAADDHNAVESGGYLRGSRFFMDRDDATIWVGNNAANGVAYFNDIRSISSEYDFLNGSTYFMTVTASAGMNTKFTVGREADVYAFTISAGTISGTNGWNFSENSNGFIEASASAGQGVGSTPGVKLTKLYHKKLSAGDSVDLTPTNRETIVVLKMKGYITKGLTLTELSVGGKTVSGFSSDIYNYNVEIDPNTLVCPKVTAEADNTETVIEITDPDTFPGKTVVKLTYGNKSVEYTVNYTSSELISNASKAVGKDFHAADDANATEVGGFKRGSQLYADRTDANLLNAGKYQYFNDIRTIADDWDYLNGTDFFSSAVGARDVTFTLNRNAVVRVFSQGTNAITAEGWTRETKSDGYMTASTTSGEGVPDGYNPNAPARDNAVFANMFYKSFNAGDTVTVSPTAKESIIVIDYVGYIEAGAMLSDLTVDGETVPGFNMSTNEYTVELDTGRLTVPFVDASAIDPNAIVEIINPGDGDNPGVFPGKAIVRVTYGDKVNEYTITYTCGELISNATKAVGKGFHAADDANASTVSGYVVGSPLYSDRTTPTTNASGLAYFNDIRTIADDWDYLNGTDFFSSAVSARSITFTLNRAATVRVFSQSTSSMSTADGWTKETDANGYMTASTTTGEGTTGPCAVFANMFYKSFNAGDTVIVSPTAKESIIVIDYIGYVDAAAVLSGIAIDGVKLADFNMNKTEYNVAVAPDTMVPPMVTAEALSDAAVVEVINPGEGDNPNVFPGKVIINVLENGIENQYVVNYTCAALTAITGMTSEGGRTDAGYFASDFHEPGDNGNTYGCRLFYDRLTVPQSSGSTINYYNDIREICDEMDYLKGTDYIMANRNQSARVTHTFTLLRPATIRAFHLSGYNSGNATLEGWTTETKEGGYIKLSHTLGAGVEGHANYNAPQTLGAMTYKEFGAGEEVSIASPGDTAVVVIEYAGYEIN